MNGKSTVYNYYDTDKGWDQTNPGWHTILIRNSNIKKHITMLSWVYNNIDGPEKHCRWMMYEFNVSGFRFRYERDYILFRLTWE